eukprot:3792706-Pyramimonas_sp.AAC.1
MIASNAADREIGMMSLKAIIADPNPCTETKREVGLTSKSFGFPLLSQEPPLRPLLRRHHSVPGPALEGPAKPSTADSGPPAGMRLTGSNENNTLANLRTTYGWVPQGTTATK